MCSIKKVFGNFGGCDDLASLGTAGHKDTHMDIATYRLNRTIGRLSLYEGI